MELSNEMKVACLYRVSTKSQVDKLTDDLPMQRNACMDFIKSKPNWIFGREYLEKGVSGYKKTAGERDVLQQVRTDAANRLFDVLLVFMFDRLGRREDETPFIIEWLVAQGIEVWSVKEGQQRFENRSDKLMNYIRFWQSGGESEKTGIRVKEKHVQMIKSGQFCGGIAPYGYKLMWSDRINNKGRRLKDIAIDEEEVEIVRLVYKLATIDGYGGHRIAMYLNEQKIPTRKDSKWGLSTINFMLRNPIYKGYPAYGKTTTQITQKNKRLNPDEWNISEVKIDHLAIIDEDVWDKAQVIRKKRTPNRFKTENIDYSNYPQQTKSPLLFTGFIRCGYCGSTLCSYMSVAKWITKSEGVKRVTRPSYRCTSINRGIKCNGQITYAQSRIEEPVLEEISNYLDQLEKVEFSQEIENIKKRNLQNDEKMLKEIEKKVKDKERNEKVLTAEIVKTINEKSSFTPEQLNAALKQNSEELEDLRKQEVEIRIMLSEKSKGVHKLINLQNNVINWSKEFENTSTDIKKMLISELIQEIVVFRDRTEVQFRIDVSEFMR